MDRHIIKYLLALTFVLPICAVHANDTLEERGPRSNRRVVKLYSGTRPKPIVCTGEGFQLDPNDCAAFHRCLKSGNGRYLSFRFQCGPGTIYDPDIGICNHPKSTKRSECGGQLLSSDLPSIDNEIIQEVPSPISTKEPVDTNQNSYIKSSTIRWSTVNSQLSSITSMFPLTATNNRNKETLFNSERFQSIISTNAPPIKRLSTGLPRFFSTSQNSLGDFTDKLKHTTPKEVTFNSRPSNLQSSSICTSDGLIGDSEDCRKFYRCVGNQRGGFIRYEFLCSNPTIWDDDKQTCNHDWAVKRSRCGRENNLNKALNDSTKINTALINEKKYVQNLTADSAIQTQLQINYGEKVTQTQTQISKSSTVQNQTQINYSDNKSEHQKQILQNQTQVAYGSSVSQTQTQINYGDKGVQTQLQIDHSNESSQSQTQISESNNTKTTTTTHEPINSASNNACTESGFRGDTNDCRKFYRCVDNGKGGFTRYEFSCSEGTVWDPSIESCNHAWAVKECGGKGTVPTTQRVTETTQSSTQVATQITTLVQSLSTTTSTTTQSNNPSEEFEADDNDIPYGNQPSLSETSSSPTTTAKEQQNADSSKCTSSGFMGDDKDCKKFYRCVDNGNGGFTRYEFSCGEGTIWDSKLEACNHIWAVHSCGENNNNGLHKDEATTVTTTTSQFPTLTQEPSLSSIPPNDDHDTSYGMQHDEAGPSSSTVMTTISTTTSTSTTQLQNESECKTSGFMGDANDCKKFYRCVDNGNGNFIKYEFTCGEGTVWDEKNQACNHVWAVEKCGGTVTENTNSIAITSQNNTLLTTTSTTTVDLFPDNNEVGYGQDNNESPSTSTVHNKPESPITNRNDCKSSGFMGDTNDCKKFYKCVDNGNGGFTRYEFTCGEGTFWDPKIDACNHAWAVENCSNSETQTVQSTSQANSINYDDNNVGYPIQNDEISEKPEINGESTTSSIMTSSSTASRECKENGFMGDPEDCKKFYRCVADGRGAFIRYEFTCGEGTAWDQTIEACNHQEKVKNCGQFGNASDNAQQSTQPISTQTTNSVTDGHDQEYQSSTQKTSTTTSSSKPSDNRCLQEGFYGDVNNCKNFYRCVDNGKGGYTKYEFTCGEGTIWNQEIQACDHESSGKENCQVNNSEATTKKPNIDNDETHTETTTNGTTSGSEQNETSVKPKPSDNKCEREGFFSDSNDCKKFYRCVDNGQGSLTKYEFVCGDGTFWNQETLTCDHEYTNDNCKVISASTSTTTTEINSENTGNLIHNSETTLQSTSLEDQCSSEGFYADSKNCKSFYRCVSNGKGGFTKYDFTCGEGTIWVQEIQACDHDNGEPNCSDQSNQSKPQTTEIYSTTLLYSSTLPQSTQSNGSDKEDDDYTNGNSNKPSSSGACTSEGFYANNDDCTKFYRCVDNAQGNFTRFDFTCGQGTAWNNDIQTCDHIDQVKSCSNSNQQQDSQSKPVMDDENLSLTTESTNSTGSTSSSQVNKDTCEQEGYFGNSNDCTKFYRCVDNGNGGFTKHDFDCGEGTIWDQDLMTCNHPQDVVNPSCKNNAGSATAESSNAATESSTTTSSSSTSTASQNATENGSQNTTNCSQESTTKKPSSQKIKCEEAGYYPDPDDCKKFYRCVDWDSNGKRFSVYHFECGEGTIWDPALQTCNHENSVYPPRGCSGTQNQNENVPQETTTTEKSTTSQENTTSEETTQDQTTEQTTITEKTTTQKSTTSEQTTQQTTSEKTTQQTTSSEQTTTTEQSLTEQTTTSSQQTTEQSTTQQITTSSQPTTKQSTTQQTTTSSQQTTQETTAGEQTTTQQSTSSKQTTTEPVTNVQTTQSSSNEQTTTTQATTEGQTTTTEQITTEQTTTEQLTTEQSTTEQSTTEQSTDGDTTTQSTISTVEQYTTESTTQQTTESDSITTEASKTTTENTNNSSTTENNQESTTEDSSAKECPETEENQYLYVCPTSFRRHPKYCNMFYQCTEDDDSNEIKIATFTCPNNTIYDESKTQCVEEDKANKRCNGEKARRNRVKRLNSYSKEPIEASHNKYTCVAEGNYPFEKGTECSGGFLKCNRTKSGQLRGFVYRCPEGFIYWSISKRCEKKDYMKDCKQSSTDWRQRWEIPVETKNIA